MKTPNEPMYCRGTPPQRCAAVLDPRCSTANLWRAKFHPLRLDLALIQHEIVTAELDAFLKAKRAAAAAKPKTAPQPSPRRGLTATMTPDRNRVRRVTVEHALR